MTYLDQSGPTWTNNNQSKQIGTNWDPLDRWDQFSPIRISIGQIWINWDPFGLIGTHLDLQETIKTHLDLYEPIKTQYYQMRHIWSIQDIFLYIFD